MITVGRCPTCGEERPLDDGGLCFPCRDAEPAAASTLEEVTHIGRWTQPTSTLEELDRKDC